MQAVPAVRAAIPLVLVGQAPAALGLAVRAVSRPALSQLLRLSED
jgi:hypothetical protein